MWWNHSFIEEEIEQMASEKYTFFFGINSPYSQWHPASFTIEDITFNCAEQYMMYKKAELFGDVQCQNQIMRTNNPSEQKRLGRTVKKFKKDRWLKSAYEIVTQGNTAKVSNCF